METQNQTQPQVQTHPQGQMQPEQNFDVKGALSKLDKYNNELLNSILVVLGVVSCIFFIIPLFNLNVMAIPTAKFSLAFIASVGSLAQAMLQSSSNANANMGAALSTVGFVSFSLFLSLAMVLLPLLKQTKKHSGFTFIPALVNCIIFFMVNDALSALNNPASSGSSNPLGSGAPHIAINFFGYIYIIVQIAAILIGALILYRNNEAKKAAAGMAMPMTAYQVPMQSTNTPQYPTANPAPAAPTSSQPQAAENQSQTESQPQFCPNCGNQIEPGTKFCGNCGASIN
ncbi:zinc ribbon domain-containing protein [Lancefieldella rimae]|uniref:zinc ribbon domain-containing protein n=1 Tax=Lancefieldella rimae TaxID=1383 RepID=UPI0028800856|nr:zinc ribbon domain-containing protein [Lancefieldella rimae]